MDAALQILFSGLTLGAMYALSAIGLALVWGALGMLNMGQGALLSIGGYASYSAVSTLGLPWYLGLPAAVIFSFFVGLVIYYFMIKWMYQADAFQFNIIIATVGFAIFIEAAIIQIYTAYPQKQPFEVTGYIPISNVTLPYQTILIVCVAFVLMLMVAWLLKNTRMGRAIRATAQERDAAQLMGVDIGRVYAQVMILAAMVAAVSGVLLTSITPLSPTVGHDPMLKAFIICVIAGLGNVPGAVYSALILGIFEAAVQYLAGSRYGFPAMLILVIVVLIWRPAGVFGRRTVTRV